MQFLAFVSHATSDEKYSDAFVRGVDYLLAAQYPNGGWPQFWPLREGYYSHITYDDDAMIRTMTVLRDVANGEAPYGFVQVERRQKAAHAIDRGIQCVLDTQIRQGGKRTGWREKHAMP